MTTSCEDSKDEHLWISVSRVPWTRILIWNSKYLPSRLVPLPTHQSLSPACQETRRNSNIIGFFHFHCELKSLRAGLGRHHLTKSYMWEIFLLKDKQLFPEETVRHRGCTSLRLPTLFREMRRREAHLQHALVQSLWWEHLLQKTEIVQTAMLRNTLTHSSVHSTSGS